MAAWVPPSQADGGTASSSTAGVGSGDTVFCKLVGGHRDNIVFFGPPHGAHRVLKTPAKAEHLANEARFYEIMYEMYGDGGGGGGGGGSSSPASAATGSAGVGATEVRERNDPASVATGSTGVGAKRGAARGRERNTEGKHVRGNSLEEFVPKFFGRRNREQVLSAAAAAVAAAAAAAAGAGAPAPSPASILPPTATPAAPVPLDSIELEDVTRHISTGGMCILDIKLGARTYEIGVSQTPNERYARKMRDNFGVQWNPAALVSNTVSSFSAPASASPPASSASSSSTQHQSADPGVSPPSKPPSKFQFMDWRDRTTTSARSGFRVTAGYVTRDETTNTCGGNNAHGPKRPLQQKSALQGYRFGQGPRAHAWAEQNNTPEDAALRSLAYFIGMNLSNDGSDANTNPLNMQRAQARAAQFASKLERFADTLDASNLLHTYEIIGSSVLLYYDMTCDPMIKTGGGTGLGITWIDFSHAVLKPQAKDVEAAGMRPNNLLCGVRNIATLLRTLAVLGLTKLGTSTIPGGTRLRDYRHKWDAIYDSGKAHDREWHSTWNSIADMAAPYLHRIAGPSAHVLDVGCGTSSLGLELCRAHADIFGRLSLLDASPVCIDLLRQRHGDRNSAGGETQDGLPEIACLVGDCRKLPYEDGSVHVLLDKGTLDALDNDKDNLAMLSECRRVMVPDCGVLLSISFGAAGRLRFLAKELPGLGMRNDVYTLSSAESDAATVFLNAIYVVRADRGTYVDYAPDARTKLLMARALDVDRQDEDPDASFSAEASEQLAGFFGNDSESDVESN
jgi:ubiquinone/menaquinone biosynthesis C-methylase UbiE